ncbi:thiamine diphosphokinase [Fluoribacter gormanii]|uniref:Thiamine diphosphokinase n=1 Tax=Fluoribacter gormanii TaxID=464 RepID=A0A377GN56_9GAMM|nr:thiamine diphosphokinase [Fluoribacter gormanii]KTD05129.1 thiamin pyrophosphokinase [Fluoribacter gormanii]MCW8445571.1 thiamine diphosphokinase [Fluoribacter gormanii]SIR00247.1 thiamine pyrophosphokinase [Fluoribacter gormanii]STO26054.1 Thiamine pyrophosphokinase [Fluoribacter gormanii]
MHDVINLSGYQSILCLNGELPDSSFFVAMNLPIIAADGAANSLFKLGIRPQLITGDLDSVRPTLLESHPFLHDRDQNSSDYQKALNYLKDNDLLPAIIVGMNGGHLDHILNNINIFMETNCLLYAPPIRGFVLNEQSRMKLSLPVQTKISLMGIPEATLSSIGLQWDLNDTHLSFPGKTSCFNRTLLPEIVLEVHHGSVLVLIYERMIEDAALSVR